MIKEKRKEKILGSWLKSRKYFLCNKISKVKEYVLAVNGFASNSGVHIIPFLIPNGTPNGIGIENTFRGMKVHFICHFEL